MDLVARATASSTLQPLNGDEIRTRVSIIQSFRAVPIHSSQILAVFGFLCGSIFQGSEKNVGAAENGSSAQKGRISHA